MARAFSHENPVLGDECMRVARHVASGIWGTGSQEVPVGLVWWRGSPWVWHGGRWVEVGVREIESTLWCEMENLHVERRGDGGDVRVTRWKMCGAAMKDVLRAVEALSTVGYASAPFELGPEKRVEDPRWTLTFEDKVVDVRTGKEWEPGPWWFDPCVLRAKVGGEGSCPVWEKAVQKWSCGDPEWVECYRRMLGYAVLPGRDLQRWFLMYGPTRTGKGTTMRVLKALLGKGMVETSPAEIVGAFGLGSLLDARVATMPEVSETGGTGGKFASIVKSIVGRDGLMVNRKFKDPVMAVLPSLVVMQSNQLPDFPDRSKGLTNKMVLMPFRGSSQDDEDTDLERKLLGELDAIARWVLEGAKAVAREEGTGAGKRVWSPASAADDVESVGMEGSQVREFVVECLQPGGFTTPQEIWEVWKRWRDETGHGSPGIGRLSVYRRVLEEITAMRWKVERSRTADQRYLRGVRPKAEWKLSG